MDIKARARKLRANMTDAEHVMWWYLRNRRLNEIKFRRQVPVGRYIVDFLSAEKKLIIEIDGGQHAEKVDYDSRRTKFLESKGYKVIRFWNNDVTENIEGVLFTLTLALSQRERERK